MNAARTKNSFEAPDHIMLASSKTSIVKALKRRPIERTYSMCLCETYV